MAGKGNGRIKSIDSHGVDAAGWDNIGEGWFIWCLCGFSTPPNKLMAEVGADFDDHLREVGVLKEE